MSPEGDPGKGGGKGRRERLGEFGYRLSQRYVVPARACCRGPLGRGPIKGPLKEDRASPPPGMPGT
jgi:hypothetical protein